MKHFKLRRIHVVLALLAVALALGATVAAVLLVRNGEKQSVLEVREGNPVSVR